MPILLRLLLGALLGLLAGTARAQAPAWESALAVPAGRSKVYAVVTDASGSVYVAGYFTGTATLGGTTYTGPADTGFVAKWDAAGQQLAWVQLLPGSSRLAARALAVGNGQVYVAGTFSQSATFGSRTLSAPGPYDAGFVAGLSAATGTVSWARAMSSAQADCAAWSLAVSGPGVYVAGYFHGSLTLDARVLTSRGSNDDDAFVAKLTEAGAATAFTWAYAAGGSGDDYGLALAASGPAVYLGGVYRSPSLQLGSLTLTPPLPRPFDNLGYVARLTDAGPAATWAWGQLLNSSRGSEVAALAASGAAVYVGGRFNNTLQAGSLVLTSPGVDNGCVLKLLDAGAAGTWAWAAQTTTPYNSSIAAVAVSGAQVLVLGNFFGPLTLGGTPVTTPDAVALVAGLLDGGGSGTWTWSLTITSAIGNPNPTSLAVGGSRAYVGGWGSGPLTFGAATLPGLTQAGGGYLAVVGGVPLPTTPGAAAPPWRLWPNPAPGPATLAGAAPATPGRVLDALGHEVAAFRTDAAGTAALPAGLAPGLYLVRVGAATARWVVE